MGSSFGDIIGNRLIGSASGRYRSKRSFEQPTVTNPVGLQADQTESTDGDSHIDDMYLDSRDVWTVNIWAKLEVGTTGAHILTWGDANFRQFGLTYIGSGLMFAYFANTFLGFFGSGLNDGNWHLFSIKCGGPADLIYQSIDGAAYSILAATPSPTDVNGYSWRIGSIVPTPNDMTSSLQGYAEPIDEFTVFSWDFSNADISELYNSGCPNNPTTHSGINGTTKILVGWWPLGLEGGADWSATPNVPAFAGASSLGFNRLSDRTIDSTDVPCP